MKKYFALLGMAFFVFGAGCNSGGSSSDANGAQMNNNESPAAQMGEADKEYVLSVFQEQFPQHKDSTTINITTSTQTHARGFVNFGEGAEQLFFAAKIQTGWDVIFVKQPNYQCEAVNSYDFPPQMIEDCIAGLTVADAQAIQKALADKYGKSIEETSIRATDQSSQFARGSVIFSANPDELMNGGGGLFLAAKVNGVWQIIFDGNGSYACGLVEPYGFPPEMVQDCAP